MKKIYYGELLVHQLVTTEFIQKKLIHLLISFTSNIINFHLTTLICIFITIHPILDFFIHLIISIFMGLNVGKIYNFCQRYTDEFSIVTKYVIKNYSIAKFRYWKRIVNLFLCFYASILLLFIEITNWMLFITILHHALCSLITEQFEQNNVQYWIEEYKNKPIVKSKQDNILINSYMSENSVKRRNLNISLPPKNIITSEDYKQSMYDSITNDDKKSLKLCKSNFF